MQNQTMAERCKAVQFHMQRQELPDALALLQEAVKQDPNHPHAAALMISVLRLMGRNQDALQYVQGLPHGLKTGNVLHLYADLLFEFGRVDEAEELIEQAQDHIRKTPGYKLAKVRIVTRRKGLEEGLATCRRLRSETGPPGLFREEADILIALGQSRAALDLLSAALDISPNMALMQLALRLGVEIGDSVTLWRLLDRHADMLADQPWNAYYTARACEMDNDPDRALEIAEKGAMRFPRHMQLNMLHWQLLLSTGRRKDAIAAATRYAEDDPENIRAQTQAAQFLNRLGADEAVDAALERCRTLGADNAGLFITRAEVMMQRKDAFGARELLYAMPPSMQQQDMVQIKIAQAEAITDALPMAIERLHPMTQPPKANANARLNAAQFCVRLGRFDAARRYLEGLEASVHDEPRLTRLHMIQSEIEVEQGRPGAAYDHALQAIAVSKDNEPAWNLRTRYALLLGRIDEAWESHRQATRIGLSINMKGNRHNKTNASHHGQMVNEYRLQMAGEDLSLCAADAPQELAMAHFKARFDQNPGSTPLALCLFSAMFRAGRIPDLSDAPRAGAGDGAIPRKLFQYWDKAKAPQQVEWLFRRNAAQNPDFDYRRFDRASAVAFLREKGEIEVLRAFQLSPHAAAQSDLFRLAVLWHEGGVYLDADDLCMVPLSDILPRDLRLGGVLEDWMSVGNNFLAVRPRDPIIREALDDAARAFKASNGESIWLATGPGATSRAVAKLGVETDGTLSEGIWLQPLPRLRESFAPHIVLSYKDTRAHWMEKNRQAPRKAGSGLRLH